MRLQSAPLTAVSPFPFQAGMAAHETLVGADGVLALPGTTHGAAELLALVLVCEAE